MSAKKSAVITIVNYAISNIPEQVSVYKKADAVHPNSRLQNKTHAICSKAFIVNCTQPIFIQTRYIHISKSVMAGVAVCKMQHLAICFRLSQHLMDSPRQPQVFFTIPICHKDGWSSPLCQQMELKGFGEQQATGGWRQYWQRSKQGQPPNYCNTSFLLPCVEHNDVLLPIICSVNASNHIHLFVI